MKNIFINVIFFCCLLFITGCSKDFLDTTSEENVTGEQLANNPAALQAIINGIYANIRSYQIGGNTGHIDYGLMSTHAGLDLMTNDVVMVKSHWYVNYYRYTARQQDNTRTSIVWNTYYSQVAEANSVINAIDEATEDPVARALLGQAYALRALFTFNTARIYADSYVGSENNLCIPLTTGISFDGKPRSTVAEVYERIVNDLEKALVYLDGYVRANKQEVDLSVAKLFFARVHLEMENWSEAAAMANEARIGLSPMNSDEWLSGFSNIGLSEAMWGSDIDNESSTIFASFFSHFDNLNGGYAGALGIYKSIDKRLYESISDSDIRKRAFVSPDDIGEDGVDPVYGLPAYANVKFRDQTFFEGDYIYVRTAEAYLIEAEALARMGDGSAADVLFDLVSSRDPEYQRSNNTGEALINEILTHKRIELWGEGVAFFDMKRNNMALVRNYDGSNHADFGKLDYPANDKAFNWQIPQDEINANDAISQSDQNPL